MIDWWGGVDYRGIRKVVRIRNKYEWIDGVYLRFLKIGGDVIIVDSIGWLVCLLVGWFVCCVDITVESRQSSSTKGKVRTKRTKTDE